MQLRVIDSNLIRLHLGYPACIALVREAMQSLSRGKPIHAPRQILPLRTGQAFGVMPGAMGLGEVFGAKLVSVFPPGPGAHSSHQGVVVLFDPDSGAPVAILDAGEITRIRTAAASAVATAALARAEASQLAILGYGEQARAHIAAIKEVRPLSRILVWGRDRERRERFVAEVAESSGIACIAVDSAEAAASEADIICTTTSASEPILEGAWVRPGTHVNIVGSSHAGPAEIDVALVVASRFVADHRASVLRQGAEFLRAKAAGRVDDDHVVAEIGQVLLDEVPGRSNDEQITVYKSLGHIVQDLCSAWHVYQAVMRHDR